MNAALDLDETELSKAEKIETTLSQLRTAGWMPTANNSKGYEAALVCLITELQITLPERALCDYLPHGKPGIGFIDVLNTMANLGYLGHHQQRNIEYISTRLYPCLYIPKNGGPIVLLAKNTQPLNNGNRTQQTTYTFYDCRAEHTVTLPQNEMVNGYGYIFTREADSPQPLTAEYMNASGFTWFRALLERFKSLFWQVFSVSIMINLVAIAAPLFVMLVYDKVIGTHSPETLSPLIMGAFLALISEGILRMVRLRSLSWFSSRVDTIVGNHIFSQLVFMPISFTERASVSAQIARIKAFETIRDFFNGPLFLAIIELPFTLIILAAIAIVAGQLAYIPLIMGGLYLVLLYFTSTRLRTATKLAGRNQAAKQEMMFETFQKMHGLRASGIDEQWLEKFRKVSGKASLASFNTSLISSQIEVISHAMFVMAGLLIIYFGVMGVLAGAMTTGALIATTLLVWRILTPFKILCNSISRFEQVRNAIDQVNRLMAINTEAQESQSHTRVNDLKGHISFSKVGIRYNKKSDPVFTGLSFEAKPGDLIAITGGNGSGKSTILQLINGFYKPQAGNIRIDGLDIRQLDLMDLRKNIAYVPQISHFFNGTIAENLRMADPLASDKSIKVVLNQVDAWEDICQLPQGIETLIGEDGMQLPSGLSYKLNLARAYIKNTQLMLFDELPYALLNSSAGEAFRKTLERWRGHRTVIIVTHREDYIKMADTVILLTTGDFPIVGSPTLIIEAINKSNN